MKQHIYNRNTFFCELVSMAKVCLIIFSGIPGSGKTTVAKKLCETGVSNLQLLSSCQTVTQRLLGRSPTYFHHVCYDQLIPRELEVKIITCSIKGETFSEWKHQRAKIVQCIERCVEQISCCQGEGGNIHKSVDANEEFEEAVLQFSLNFEQRISTSGYERHARHIFVIDDNMYYRSMRYEYFQLARKYNAAFAQVQVTCPVATALERNSKREERVPDQIIKNMAEKLEHPNNEVFWEKFSMEFDTSQDMPRDLDPIYKLIAAALAEPYEPVVEIDSEEKELSRVQCSTSVLHQADQILRKLIAREMAENKGKGWSKEQLSFKAESANDRKGAIYNKLRSGTLLIPETVNETSTDASKDETSQLFIFLRTAFQSDS